MKSVLIAIGGIALGAGGAFVWSAWYLSKVFRR